ncbi:MAG: D-cysteine desulfhydrase family protein [Acidimicrobiia bacterium]|nr:D-cysteine desulfhydrase family protein [Acidimicrobiia bacterium]
MTPELPPHLPLGLSPTPLEYAERLSSAWEGPQIWIKRDDLTGFGLSGNKVRKLEFHFAAARENGADTVITCGALQSNHCRATALAAARVGLECLLLLRVASGTALDLAGNYLLDKLAGAEVRFITPEDWRVRDDLMAAEALRLQSDGRRAHVIPEGASDALGMWGFVVAMREIADQGGRISGPAPVVWHAASSGGTTAGIGWAVERLALDMPIVACSIGDPAKDLEVKVDTIWQEAAAATGASVPATRIDYNDSHIGGGYGLVTDEELAIQAEATALTGLIFDPTYTGKALVGLRREIAKGTYGEDHNVIFWHTGGGFAVFAHDFSRTAFAADRGVPDV